MTRRSNLDCEVVHAPRHAAAISHARACAWQGCEKSGEYRAPKDRSLKEYYLFCLDHVRAYNAKWDFHAGLGAAEIEAEIRRATTWERPTWKLGTVGAGSRTHVRDPFDFAADMEFAVHWQRKKTSTGEGRKHRAAYGYSSLAAHNSALQVFDLTVPVTLEVLRRRYKVLVKQYHPDANGGSRAAENQMKVINEAYQTLRGSLPPSV